MLVLGIETSCDETACAIVKDGKKIYAEVVATQIPYHRRFGGVVPELASRKHLETINTVIEETLFKSGFEMEHIDRLAVTVGPGLAGSLLVGITAARTLGEIYSKPVFGVNHILSHLSVNFLNTNIGLPYIGLTASGGHCDLIFAKSHDEFEMLGRTRDDAPGEAFDKTAKLLGFPYPGGTEIEKLASGGNDQAFKFPVPKFKDGSSDFSFSGIKTFVKNLIAKTEKEKLHDLAASFQNSIASIFADKLITAAKRKNCPRIIVAGGVMANSYIIARLEEECAKNSIQLFYPPAKLCTDNAVMIACRGFRQKTSLPLIPAPDLKI
ncbi:MAG: tRNA (adenosine(37)-N6)-threonylcarbamoyltransferase complex transferase subunit TsaD [Elusimicrobiota bacterium]|nr:tRNA (adenosine(37)-N6)-threonylcarbamoyltransferase complex transferase subunit TsaD [Elusimicrobiota bacterium]